MGGLSGIRCKPRVFSTIKVSCKCQMTFLGLQKAAKAPGHMALALGDIKGQGGGGNPCFPSGNSARGGPSPGPRRRLFETMATATFADERGISVHSPATWIKDVSSLFTRGGWPWLTSVLLRPWKRPRAPWSSHVANPGGWGLHACCSQMALDEGLSTLHPWCCLPTIIGSWRQSPG